MITISHRGNLKGPDGKTENTNKQIQKAIDHGFDVEIDLHYYKSALWLGHDEPNQKLNMNLFTAFKKRLWCHAKDTVALEVLLKERAHCFWHEEDHLTLTSKNYCWVHPKHTVWVPPKSVLLSFGPPSMQTRQLLYGSNYKAICTDYPSQWENCAEAIAQLDKKVRKWALQLERLFTTKPSLPHENQ